MAAPKKPADHKKKGEDKAEELKSYDSLEALEAESSIPDIEPYRVKIAEDEDGEPVEITFRPYTDFSFEEMDSASIAEMAGDVLSYFRIALSAEDLVKVNDYGIKAYQMGMLMGASQRYYAQKYGTDNPLGNF